MMLKLPKDVEFILDRIHENGYEAFVVGGPTRDMLRGVVPHDYDITTSAVPEKIKEIFSDKRTIDTGIAHGTVTLILSDTPYEITTYRIDGEYLDARHPSGVSFCENIALDLERRDFTVNAIAYNPRVGIVDTTGGTEDIKNRIIRCVGSPDVRFSEDALRILRAVRFSSTLGFEIEEGTANAVLSLYKTLLLVSRERVYTEIKKMLAGEFLSSVIDKFLPVLALFFPEWEKIESPSRYVKGSDDFLVNLITLFAVAGADAEIYAERMKALRADGATIRAGMAVLSALERHSLTSREGVILALLELGEEYTELLIKLARSVSPDTVADGIELSDIIKSVPHTLRELRVSGSDLSPLGFVGAEIGKTLSALLRSAALGEVENEKEALLKLAKSYKK